MKQFAPVVVFLLISALASVSAQEPTPPAKPTPVPAAGEKAPADAKPAPEAKPKSLELGKRPTQMIALPDLDGRVHRSAEFADQITVICFWSTTCPVMQGYEERMAAIVKEFSPSGVRFLMINSNEGNLEIDDGPTRAPEAKPADAPVAEPDAEAKKPYAKIRAYLAEHELPYTVLVDHGSRVADLFEAKTTPHIYVFGKDGVLWYRGAIDDDAPGRKGEKATPHLRNLLTRLLAGETVEAAETKPVGCNIKRPAASGRRGR